MKKAEHNRSGRGPWVWQTVKATAYGVTRKLRVVSFQAVWPEVRGLRPILVVLVRDPRGKFQDKYLFTTDLNADLGWIIAAFSRRWSIEVAFKSSKQVMKIQSPQHWCQKSVETLSPWVWLMQSVIGLWYFTEGRKLPVAQAARGASASGTRNGRLLICSAFSVRQSSKLQLTPSRLPRPTCVSYSKHWKTT